jgi:beta-lactamase regulating signal transducer with metallopeptidase domain/Leucine-rich repeat (LRR) protein
MKKHFSILLLAAWALVAAIMAMRCLFSVKSVRRMVRDSRSAPLRLYRLMERVAQDTRCRSLVNLRLSPDLGSPFLAGLIRPVMVLPERMADEDHADELPAVLAHELAHLNSYDLVWITLGRWVSVLLWFHPLAWKVRAAHATACEQVCDAVAADYAGGAPAYSRTLARLALELVVDAPAVGGIPMIRTSQITRRLRNLKRGIKAAALARRWVVASVLLGCVTLLGIGCLKLVSADKPEADAPGESEGYMFGPVIERWINDNDAGEDFGIDFDTGLLGDPSPKNGKGVDGMVDVSGKPKNIICFDMVVLAADHVWEGDPSAIVERLKGCTPGSHGYMSAEGELPKSFLFKTREGGMGVLQILELSDTDEPRGVRIRYKLIQEEEGTAGRIVRFPNDRSLGKLFVRDIGPHAFPSADWEPLAEARGTVHVSAGKQVRLDVSKEAAKDLSPLAQVAPDDLYYVMLWHTEAEDDALRNLAYLTGLQVLDLRYARITDEALKQLNALTSLNDLDLGETQIGDAGLANIRGMTSLEHLHLTRTWVTEAGLAHVANLHSLKSLSLFGTHMTDGGLAHLKDLTSLQYLNLWETDIGDEGLAYLSNLTSMEDLTLHGTKITDAGLAHLRRMRSLKSLRMDDTEISDAGLVHLKELESLETLYLGYEGITDAGLAHLGELPSLKALHVGPQEGFTDAGLAHLAKIESLEELNIGGRNITDDGMAHLAKLTGLKVLWLQHSPVTDAGLAKLRPLQSLHRLLLSGTNVSGAGFAHLKELPLLSDLRVSGFAMSEDRLKHLADLTGLEWLELDDVPVTDDDMVHLANLKRLKYIEIQSGMVTDGGFAHLAGLTALENITAWGCDITDTSLAYLSNKDNLEYVQVSGQFTDEGLRHLEGLPSLRFLRIVGGDFSDEALARLQHRTPSLQLLNLGENR